MTGAVVVFLLGIGCVCAWHFVGRAVRVEQAVPLPSGWSSDEDSFLGYFRAYDEDGIARIYVTKGTEGWISKANDRYLHPSYQTRALAIAAALEQIAADPARKS